MLNSHPALGTSLLSLGLSFLNEIQGFELEVFSVGFLLLLSVLGRSMCYKAEVVQPLLNTFPGVTSSQGCPWEG